MNRMKRLVLMSLLLIVVGSLIAAAEEPGPTGALSIAGSTSMQPLSEELAVAFGKRYPRVTVIVQGGGSSAGIKAVITGAADIGASSRELKDAEKGLHETVIAWDGIAVIVNRGNRVKNLSLAQLRDVFSGKIRDWRQFGGARRPISVVNREAGSGTRGAFEELVMGNEQISSNCQVHTSTEAVKRTVSKDPNAIGYISLGQVDGTVKTVSINGVEANDANIVKKSYELVRPFIYLTRGAPSGLVKAFIDFALSSEGQAIVRREFVPVGLK